MSEKHFLVCDSCGKEKDISKFGFQTGYNYWQKLNDHSVPAGAGRDLDFCNVECLMDWKTN